MPRPAARYPPPAQPPAQETMLTPPSPVDEGDRQRHPPPNETSNDSLNVNRQATIRQTSAEQFQEAKRKALLKDLEGLIPVVTPDLDNGGPAQRRGGEEMPQMSATSYPGQEWNPYGEFAFDEED